jgi:hypothetical protein
MFENNRPSSRSGTLLANKPGKPVSTFFVQVLGAGDFVNGGNAGSQSQLCSRTEERLADFASSQIFQPLTAGS